MNRLKMIKFQMIGRANFDLLRKHVLCWPESLTRCSLWSSSATRSAWNR